MTKQKYQSLIAQIPDLIIQIEMSDKENWEPGKMLHEYRTRGNSWVRPWSEVREDDRRDYIHEERKIILALVQEVQRIALLRGWKAGQLPTSHELAIREILNKYPQRVCEEKEL